ncbi:hypothetical protein GKZ90_0018460 [Flavobacterium sp. MC2016-06]|uniref:hypothetical protein n=1 Tax=Flavobacterium sp. MC2016-06 TaxID=2676308 RepID=UPI0012BAEA93|nr:hypothetical protein [Flavobacterium sp. MC2016-06]MBU3858445.1 hypothetical protein [Flavobacterium sp. MC2016-06]
MITKRNLLLLISFLITINIFSQTDLDQNGLKSTVIRGLSATNQPTRFEIATIGYNSFHWQHGGIIIIELFNEYYGTGYEKYIIENGFGQGANWGAPVLKLMESNGFYHNGRIILGATTDLSTSFGGYVNKQLSILFDARDYTSYVIKITYLQEKVNTLTDLNQIKINQNPIGTTIPEFSVSSEVNTNIISNGNLQISGSGNHYIKNGNVGIGTINPTSKLTVAGNINSREVKVSVDAGADFVFDNDYNLPSLESVSDYIKENKHLPEIASAKEMQQNGINLSEMNIKLLQKMEEMTLYMIEMKKENEKQNEKIIALENKLKNK